ncbi:MAG: FecR domain-containing protein [Candidatus Omnitrophota bacterium]
MSKHIDINTLSLYIDNRLEEQEAEMVASHVTTCNSCRERLESFKFSKGLLGRLPEIEVSAATDAGFKERLEFEDKMAVARRPRPAFVKPIAVITTVAFVMTFVVWNHVAAMPVISSVYGEASIYVSKTGQWQAAKRGRRLGAGDIIKVAKGRVGIESKKYGVMLKEDAELKAVGPERSIGRSDIMYGLEKGKMLVATKDAFRGSTFKVDSPLAEVEATGTGFLVGVSPGRTWVGVLDGSVEVKSKMDLTKLPSKVIVGAGKVTDILPQSAPSEPRYQLESEWQEVQKIYGLGQYPQVALLVSMTPRRPRELLSPAGIYVSDRRSNIMPNELAALAVEINDAILKEDKERHIEAIHKLESILDRHPDARYNIQFRFFIASYYYYVDQYEQAIDVLDGIIRDYPSVRLLSLALCAKGLIYEEGLQDSSKAALSYEAVLSGYPQSLEAEEATAGLMRLKAE